MMMVRHFMRRSDNFSIERVYEAVRSSADHRVKISVWRCRFRSQGILRRIADTVFAAFSQGRVNHVTGDVHFLTFLMRKRRTILTIHDCISLERTDGLRRFLIWLIWYWIPVRRAARIVVISEWAKKQLCSHVKVPDHKLTVIPNPVPREFCYMPRVFDESKPTILVIGTGANKNLERLFESIKGLSCKLSIIGELSKEQEWELVRNQINFVNKRNLSSEEIVQEYISCDMIAFVSTYEGFGMPVIEAQKTGRPVIGSNYGPIPEVGGSGVCLVDPFDVASIRAGIDRVISDRAYREELVRAGRENVQKYNALKIATRYVDLYCEVGKKAL